MRGKNKMNERKEQSILHLHRSIYSPLLWKQVTLRTSLSTGYFTLFKVHRSLHWPAFWYSILFSSILFYQPSSVMGHHKNTALRSEVLTEIEYQSMFTCSVCTT